LRFSSRSGSSETWQNIQRKLILSNKIESDAFEKTTLLKTNVDHKSDPATTKNGQAKISRYLMLFFFTSILLQKQLQSLSNKYTITQK
jgi:hypothetical protein